MSFTHRTRAIHLYMRPLGSYVEGMRKFGMPRGAPFAVGLRSRNGIGEHHRRGLFLCCGLGLTSTHHEDYCPYPKYKLSSRDYYKPNGDGDVFHCYDVYPVIVSPAVN